MIDVSSSGRDFTVAQAAEYINNSAPGRFVGRTIGPFKGMDDATAMKAAVEKIQAHLEHEEESVTPEARYKIFKAMTKIQEIPLDKRQAAHQIVSLYKKTKKIVEEPEDVSLLKTISKDIGVDLVHLEVVVHEKYPTLVEELNKQVKSYKEAEAGSDAIKTAANELIKLEWALCREGDFDLYEKSRPEIFTSGLRRTATSAINLLVNLPLGAARLAASPFIALAGVVTLVGRGDSKLLKLAVSEAALGTAGALNSVVGLVGTAVGTVVDPIIGKEYVREAQLYARAGITYVANVYPHKLHKFPQEEIYYQKVLKSISNFMSIADLRNAVKHLKGKSISKWHPAADQIKASQFASKMISTFHSKNVRGSKKPTIQSARIERKDIRGKGEE